MIELFIRRSWIAKPSAAARYALRAKTLLVYPPTTTYTIIRQFFIQHRFSTGLCDVTLQRKLSIEIIYYRQQRAITMLLSQCMAVNEFGSPLPGHTVLKLAHDDIYTMPVTASKERSDVLWINMMLVNICMNDPVV